MQWAPHQLRWLYDPAPVRCANKSRQIGWSEVKAHESAARALGFDLTTSPPRFDCKPRPQNMTSASEKQAIELLRKTKVHIGVLGKAFAGNPIKHENAHQVVLHDGTELRAFAPNPRTMRGVNGDVTLDEFAATRDQELVWKAALPMTAGNPGNPRGYGMSVISTPEGDGNLFHALMRDARFAHVSRHTCTIERALREGWVLGKSLEQLIAEVGDPDAYAQEYMCSFLASSMRYISAELWGSRCVEEHQVPVIPFAASRFGGYDVGRHHDAAAYGEIAHHDSKLWQNGLVEYEHKMPFDEQETWIGKKVSGGVLRIAIDATGMGEVQAERLVNVHRSRIEPVKFTLQSKAVLATGLKHVLERRIFAPRADDIQLRREVLLMRRVVSEAGNIRFDIQRTKGAHGDGAWAVALAIHASGLAAKKTEPVRPDAVMPHDPARDRRVPTRPVERSRRGAWK
jgi:phage FluMu gp28-like protein